MPLAATLIAECWLLEHLQAGRNITFAALPMDAQVLEKRGYDPHGGPIFAQDSGRERRNLLLSGRAHQRVHQTLAQAAPLPGVFDHNAELGLLARPAAVIARNAND